MPQELYKSHEKYVSLHKIMPIASKKMRIQVDNAETWRHDTRKHTFFMNLVDNRGPSSEKVHQTRKYVGVDYSPVGVSGFGNGHKIGPKEDTRNTNYLKEISKSRRRMSSHKLPGQGGVNCARFGLEIHGTSTQYRCAWNEFATVRIRCLAPLNEKIPQRFS